MKPTFSSQPQSPPRGLMVRCAALALLVPLLLAGCSRLGSDVDALADSVIKSSGNAWEKKFSLGLGSAAFGLARAGLSYVDLPPEARTALQSVRSADVKIYQARSGASGVTGMEMIAKADKAMNKRGLERAITVCQKDEVVVIYLPSDASSAKDLEICLLVRNREHLVIAGTQSNLQPLLKWMDKIDLPALKADPELVSNKPSEFQIVGRRP